MSNRYFLGIDGGGTSCRARLTDNQGRTLGEGLAGSANVRLGIERSYRAILEASHQAVVQAGLSPDIYEHCYVGMGLAGAISESICRQVMDYPHPFAGIAVATDAHTACLGAHAGNDGAILILGTGSCGVARVDGRFHTIGGWGFPISDQGSGAWIGLELVRYALQANDNVVPSTPLSDALMARFNHNPADVVAWMDQSTPRDFGAFMPLVIEFADKQDNLAESLLDRAAAEASLMLRTLLERGAKKVCLMGGISQVLRPRLTLTDSNCLQTPVGDALQGSLVLIRQQLESFGSSSSRKSGPSISPTETAEREVS